MSDCPKTTTVALDDLSLLIRMFVTLITNWQILGAIIRAAKNPNDQDAQKDLEKEVARVLQEHPEDVQFIEEALKQLEGKQEQLLEFFEIAFSQSASGQE